MDLSYVYALYGPAYLAGLGASTLITLAMPVVFWMLHRCDPIRSWEDVGVRVFALAATVWCWYLVCSRWSDILEDK